MKLFKKLAIYIGATYLALLAFDLWFVKVYGQTPTQALTVVIYSNITAANLLDRCDVVDGDPCIDNRSQFLRQSSISSFRVVGTGAWSVDMQFSDGNNVSWVSFGSTGQVSNTGPASGVGYGIGPAVIAKPYHDYIRFVITGNATILNYNGTRQFWWLPSVASIAFPITSSQGGTGSASIFNGVTSAQDAANWATAISSLSNGNVLILPTSYQYTTTAGATLSANNVTIQCQAGSFVKAGANAVILTITGNGDVVDGCSFNGNHSGSGYSSDCVDVIGTNGTIFRNLPSVTNCGFFGIYFDGTTTINQHFKVLNSTFTNNQQDGIFARGLVFDLEWAGNTVDGSGNAAATHAMAVHYEISGTTPPHGIKIHHNTVTAGPYNAIEIGCFLSPYAKTCWPYDVDLDHNLCIISSAFSSGSSGPACDSLSDVQYFTIDHEIVDAQGHAFYNGPEIIGAHGTVNGQIQKNCAAAQIGGIVINQSQDIDVGGGSYCGQISIGISGPAGNILDIPMPQNRVHDVSVSLQSGFITAALANGFSPSAVWIQLNDVDSSMTGLGIYNNHFLGNSTSDGSDGVVINNFACTSSAVVDHVKINDNFFDQLQSGLASDGCTHTTNIEYDQNHFGSGVGQFDAANFTFSSILADNFGFGHYSAGFTPTCTLGTGADGIGTGPCTNSGGGITIGDYFGGVVKVVASGSPATASPTVPKVVFTFTFPNAVFQIPPSMMGNIPCTFTPYFNDGGSLVYQAILNINVGFASVQMLTTTTLVSGQTYAWGYTCH